MPDGSWLASGGAQAGRGARPGGGLLPGSVEVEEELGCLVDGANGGGLAARMPAARNRMPQPLPSAMHLHSRPPRGQADGTGNGWSGWGRQAQALARHWPLLTSRPGR